MSLDPLSSTTERQSIAPNLASFRGVFNPASYYFYGDIVQSPLDQGLYVRSGEPVTGLDPSAASPANWVPFSRGSGLAAGAMTSAAAAAANGITFGGSFAGNVLLPGATYLIAFTVTLQSTPGIGTPTDVKLTVLPSVSGTSTAGMSIVVPPIAAANFQSFSVAGILSHSNVAAQPLLGVLELGTAVTAVTYTGETLIRLF